MALDIQPDVSHLDIQPDTEDNHKKIPQVLKDFVGGNDAALTMLLSTPAFIGGGVAGLGTTLMTGNPAAGADVASKIQEKYSVDPFTESGKAAQELLSHGISAAGNYVGEAAYDLKDDPSVGGLFGGEEGRSVGEAGTEAALNFLPLGRLRGKGKAKEIPLSEKVKEAQAKLDAAKTPLDIQPEVGGEGAFKEMHDQLRAGENSPVDFSTKNPVPGMADQLGQMGTESRGRVADEAIAARQAAMEADVAQKGGLDYNAAERARQEEATLPLSKEEDTMRRQSEVENDPNVSPEHKEWYQMLLDEASKDDKKTSGTPAFFKDPDPSLPNPPSRVPRSQRGAVNPEVFKEGFSKIKSLGNGLILRAAGDGARLIISAIKNGEEVGGARFDPMDRYEQWRSPNELETGKERGIDAVSGETWVHGLHRGKGYASEIYKFASELGNDVRRSDNLTPEGRGMWNGFDRAGLSNNGKINSPGNRQMGGVLFGDNPAKKQLEKVLGKQDMMAEKPDMDAAIAASRGLPDGKTNGNFASGMTLEAMKRRSPVLEALGRVSQYAQKVGDLNIRKNVLPVEKAFRKLSREQVNELSGVLKAEMLREKRFDGEALERMPVEMQVAYGHMRDMLDDSWRIQNEQRVADGLKPITRMEAYASSMWSGDFRRPIFKEVVNEAGTKSQKLVWYLAAHSKRGIAAQTKALLKQFPDLIVDPSKDHTVKTYRKQTDLQSAYPTIIDILGRDDPAVADIKAHLENQTVNEAASFLGQQKHFEPKAGIRGFVGDRPGKEGFNEALKFIEQQVQYAKNSYQWSAIQSVSGELKKAISDPELAQTQQKNMKYARDYVKNLLGRGEHAAVAALADSFRDGLGFSPNLINRGISDLKSFFIIQKLAGLGQVASNLIQPVNMIAHLLSNDYAGSRQHIITAIPVGIAGGMAMATGHFATFLRDMKGTVKPDDMGFYQRAFHYAEDNGITARSIVDESPIGTTFSVPGTIGKGLGKFLSVPEAFARSIAFMTATQFLKDSGKYKTDMELFQKAEDYVNAGMVDYRQAERPLAFSKAGGVGNALNTLQNYPINWYNQFNLFAKEAVRGNPAPFVAFLATQYAIAGAMGIPGFNDVDKLYQFLKNNVISKFPTAYAKVQESEFWTDPKMWMVKHFGESAVYGALSAKSNLGLTSRLNTPGMTDMIQAPGGPAIDIAKQGINAVKAVTNPTRDNIAQSAMSSVPLGAQGIVENLPQFEGSTFERTPDGGKLAMSPGNIGAHKAVYKRDDADTTARMFGFRTQKEAVSREIGYRLAQDSATGSEVIHSIPNKFYAALKNGDKEAAKDLYTAYAKLSGTEITQAQLEREIMENFIPTIERATTAAKTVNSIKNVVRARELFNQIQQEHQK
jgi:hypothetical protein